MLVMLLVVARAWLVESCNAVRYHTRTLKHAEMHLPHQPQPCTMLRAAANDFAGIPATLYIDAHS